MGPGEAFYEELATPTFVKNRRREIRKAEGSTAVQLAYFLYKNLEHHFNIGQNSEPSHNQLYKKQTTSCLYDLVLLRLHHECSIAMNVLKS